MLDAVLRGNGKKLSEVELEILRNYRRSLNDIQAGINDIYARHADKIAEKKFPLARLKGLSRQIQENIAQLLLKDAKVIKQTLSNFYQENYSVINDAMSLAANVDLSFNELDEKTINAAVENQYDKIKWKKSEQDNIKKLIGEIRTEITQGIIQGKGIAQTNRAVVDRMNIGAGRALRIVRTETHRVQNQGRLDGINNSKGNADLLGIKVKTVWNHKTYVKDPRELHVAMDGKTADKEGNFTLPDGVKTKAPGLSNYPEHDIHCHCFLTMEFENL